MAVCDCHNVGAIDEPGHNRVHRWAICCDEDLTTLSPSFADLFYGWNVNVLYSEYEKLTASQQKELDDLDNVTIVGKSTAKADISIDAPESAYEGDDVVINITVTNTGVITADMCVELYDGSTRIGDCAATSPLKSGEAVITQYTRNMPNHDWNLTAKVVSDPPIDVTKNFTIVLIEEPGTGTGGTNIGCGGECPNTCDGTSLYRQKCVNGHCERDLDGLIETNSPTCGYVPPSEEPPLKKGIIDQISDMLGLSNKQLIYAAVIAIVIILLGSRSS